MSIHALHMTTITPSTHVVQLVDRLTRRGPLVTLACVSSIFHEPAIAALCVHLQSIKALLRLRPDDVVSLRERLDWVSTANLKALSLHLGSRLGTERLSMSQPVEESLAPLLHRPYLYPNLKAFLLVVDYQWGMEGSMTPAVEESCFTGLHFAFYAFNLCQNPRCTPLIHWTHARESPAGG